MKKFTTKLNEMNEADSVDFIKIQEDALRMLKDATNGVVNELKEKWFDAAEDDMLWLEEKYIDETLKNLSEVIARKVKS
jgi:hypothetical protein